MAGTRSSTRRANGSSPISSQDNASTSTSSAGTKRKSNAASTPKAKRGKKGGEKQQKTLEETLPDKDERNASKDVEMEEAAESKVPDEEDAHSGQTDHPESALRDREDALKAREDAVLEKEKSLSGDVGEEGDGISGAADVKTEGKNKDSKDQEATKGDSSRMGDTGKIEPEEPSGATGIKPTGAEGDAVKESLDREKSTPSSILEKGIIYFFFRGRVGIDEPSDVGDIARSYIVLRPLPHGAKLGDGPIGDAGNNRLLALPKKVLPVSPRDKFMIFVEKANCSMEDIKQTLAASDYATKTAGSRHTPAAAPIGEGIYAITTTGRESHLAYILTIPSELSEVQHDVGLGERGSFVTSVKNPQYAGPANTNLPQGPAFPQE